MDFREDFHEIIRDSQSDTAQLLRKICDKRLREQLPNKPELWEKLTPNYALGCKRLILSDDYYPALNRGNVDLETRLISRITDTGIEVEGGILQEHDLIILATGFRTVEFMCPIQIYGSKGRPLTDIWKDGASAHQGVTVEDLPNFGMFYGPNSNLGKSCYSGISSSFPLLIIPRPQLNYTHDRVTITIPQCPGRKSAPGP